MNLSKDLMAASSTPMVLGILADGESYGYDIAKRVEQLSGGALNWTDGMLYPLLHRLEQQGLLEAFWRVADSGRKRKYYGLTELGQRSLREQQQQWQLITQTLSRIWNDTHQQAGALSDGQFA